MVKTVPYNTKLISDYIINNKLTIKQFCKMCNICNGTYKKIMAQKNVAISSIIKVKFVIKVKLNVLLGLSEN